ncbi:family 1 encapsulin nanocompartment shell protein [Novispirillum sp. DQ9]|uniref:family 1 encapsulin nanocompartment shell protein n=1 Tax=Novispirillum sp. DQ9 TaxID=3398612 RepID=UPI003C7B1397
MARRFLDVDGPFGPGMTSIELGNDGYCRQLVTDEAAQIVGRAVSVPMIRKTFKLSIRRVAGFVDNGQPLDAGPVEDAAEAVAEREEELIYAGQPDFGIPGLLTAQGRAEVSAGPWSDVDRVLDDVLAAVTKLDESGKRGPYALALEPVLYNGLFRRYPGTDMLQLEHLKRLCSLGIFKAPIRGGVLVDARADALLVGQDLRAGYIGQDGVHYEMFLSESMVLRLDDPDAVCTIVPG